MSDLLLSILIPTVSRRDASRLVGELEKQAVEQPVEILWLGDNFKRKLGKKREALTSIARGRYICHLDDDDGVTEDFIPVLTGIISAIPAWPYGPETRVISYDSIATLNGESPFRVRTGIAHENEGASKTNDAWNDIKRKPWQWCCWEINFAGRATFQNGNVDEDHHWLKQLWPHIDQDQEMHLDRVMHYYNFDSQRSLCQT